MANEGTALGFSAAVLPKSKFDSTEFGQQVTAKVDLDKKNKKLEAEKIKKEAIESMDPELGKLKWTAPYVNKYEEKIKNFRDENVKWYGEQEGKLSTDQIQKNRIFKAETKAEFQLLNSTYDELSKEKQKILTSKEFNTPENMDEIERALNPYENDPEGLKEYDGDVLKYIAANPPRINPKAESYNLTDDLKSYREAFKPSTKIGAGTKDEFGNIVTPTTTGFDLNAVAVAAGDRFDTDPSLQANFDTREKYVQSITNGLSETKSTQAVTKLPKDGSGGFDFNFGAFSGKKGVVVTEGRSEFGVEGKDPSVENMFNNIDDRNIDAKVFSISNNGKPFKVSGLLPVSYSWGPKGLQKKKGGNFNTTISSVISLPTTTAEISVKDLAGGIPKEILKDIAVDGVIPAGTVISEDQRNVLNEISDQFEDKYFGVGESTGVRAVATKNDGVKPKKVALSSQLFPMEDLSVHLENQGLKFNAKQPGQPEQEKAPKEEDAPIVRDKIKGYIDKGWVLRRNTKTKEVHLYNKDSKKSLKIQS